MSKFRPVHAYFSGFVDLTLRTISHPLTLLAASAVGAIFIWELDNSTASLPFCVAVVMCVAGLFFLVSKRLAFSVYSAWMAVGLLTIMSAVKFRMKGFSLHFFDFAMVAEDSEVVTFLMTSYLHLVAPVIVVAAMFAGFCAVMYRTDRRSTAGFTKRASLLAMAAAFLPATFPAEASVEQRYFYYLQGRHASAFFISLLDLEYAFSGGDLEARLSGQPAGKPFDGHAVCGSGSRPDIIVVLEESMTDPAIFPQIAKGREISTKMAGGEGVMLPLSVETFGGGTWISNLSLMTGLSAADFGWRSPYLTMMMEGRIASSLPQVLADCGYRTAAVLPLNYTFVNEGPFLTSIGFETVLDKDAIGADFYRLRDDFYFDAASRFIDEHRRVDGRPLFMLVQTMFAHSPYEKRLEPEVMADGEQFFDDFEVDEYLRRMVIARQDFAEFAGGQRQQERDAGLVIATFGDHQATPTRRFVDEIEGQGSMAVQGSLAYRTFFTISGGRGYAKTGSALDIAYLGTAILDAAAIPGSDVFVDLRRLAAACGGKFYACADRDLIDEHLRRRIAGGLLRLGDGDPVRSPAGS